MGKGTTRCIEETNGDEYKNITTRNCCPSWRSWLSIMNIAASTMTLQTNCRAQTFVSIGTFRELQSVSMLDAWKWRNPSCLDCTWHPGKALWILHFCLWSLYFQNSFPWYIVCLKGTPLNTNIVECLFLDKNVYKSLG